MKLIDFFKKSENRIMSVLFIFVLITLGVNINLNNQNEILIEETEANCWINNVGSNGVGFASKVVLSCKALKNNCVSENHDLPCVWQEIEGQTGCVCQFWG